MNLIRRAAFLAAIVAVIFIFREPAWSQCAMCVTALQNSPEGQAVAAGFRHGIIFLLAAPYAIIGSIAIGVVKAYWKKDNGQ